jgi:Protein of unknown function (DUF4232)
MPLHLISELIGAAALVALLSPTAPAGTAASSASLPSPAGVLDLAEHGLSGESCRRCEPGRQMTQCPQAEKTHVETFFLAACLSVAAIVGVLVTAPTAGAQLTTSEMARPAKCQAQQLRVIFFGENGAAGTGNTSIAIANTSTRPCWLQGFPDVRVAEETPLAGQPPSRMSVRHAGPAFLFPAKPPRVVLRHAVAPPPGVGGRRYPPISAGFVILNADWGGPGSCPEVTSVAVRLPGLPARPVTVPTQIFACYDYISVSPLLGRAPVISAVYE